VTVKDLMRPIPGVRQLASLRHRLRHPDPFTGSADYWERRYAGGGTSGAGSYGAAGRFKAEFLNAFVREHDVRSVIELGCGDGHVLSLVQYPSYVGLDVSNTAIETCLRQFADDPAKSFILYDGFSFPERDGCRLTADTTLSLDVILHLVEDSVFEAYMTDLFKSADRYVIVYSTNAAIPDDGPHVRHRDFSSWVAHNFSQWHLSQVAKGPELADFFVYERINGDRR
jgi:SAM-dependent methyltransferase